MPFVLTVLLFAAFALILIGLLVPRSGRDPVAARLSQFAERPRTLEEMELEQPFSERVLRPIIQRLAVYAERFSRRKGKTRQQQQHQENKTEKLKKRLTLAGNPNRWTA